MLVQSNYRSSSIIHSILSNVYTGNKAIIHNNYYFKHSGMMNGTYDNVDP